MADHSQRAYPFARPPRVGLLVTCLVDLFRPNVAFATAKLLNDAGCGVEIPAGQTCCGQPAYNSGAVKYASAMAKQVIGLFAGYDYVVAPSGSCTGILKRHYPSLLAQDPKWRSKAEQFAQRCYELTSFLTDVLRVPGVNASYVGTVTYHDTCSGLRELGVQQQPRRLLATVGGLQLREMNDTEVCCGFGGTFCVKYPEISTRMVSDKAAHIENSGAFTVLGGDLGCLLNIAGRLKRQGSPIRTYHVAEVLANMTDTPAIGDRERDQ